jgi:hypothetical protein
MVPPKYEKYENTKIRVHAFGEFHADIMDIPAISTLIIIGRAPKQQKTKHSAAAQQDADTVV